MSSQVSITQLPQALPLQGTESVPIVQNGVTVQTTVGAISGAGALNYPFLTVGSTSGLTQARYFSAGSGLSLVDNGAGASLQINMTGAALSLNTSPTGIQVKTNSSTLTGRTFGVGSGLSIANGDGVAGNPVISLGTVLSNVAALSGTGLVTVNGSNFSQVSLLGTSGQIAVANGNASAGSPTFSLVTTGVTAGTYSSATFTVDSYGRLTAASSGTAGGVTFFSAGTTGLTPSTPTSGSITLAGVLVASNGGTGASTLTGYVKGNGTSAMTASTTVPTTDLSGQITNVQLVNSSVTINGTSVNLGGSISVGTVTSVTATAPVSSTGGATPVISMPAASASVNGYLTSTDWTNFNNKGSGTVTSVTGTAPIVSSGGATPAISIPAATASVNGYLTSTDWNTFNNKGSGTVTSVAALTLGTTGTDLSSTVANGTTTPVITLNVPTASATNRGALSSADWTTFNNKQPAGSYVTAISIASSNGFAGTSSGGTTPSLTLTTSVTGLLYGNGTALGAATISAPLAYSAGTLSITQATTSTNGYLSSTDWNTFNNKQPAGTYVTSVSGTAGRITSTGGTTPVIDLASGIATPGTTGSATLIPVVTIDTYGRVTSITTAANPQGTVTSVSGTGTVNGITLTGTVTSTGSLTLGGTLGGIANAQLTNSSITINGSAVSLGGSITVTATASNALTIGTGLSGTSYNGSAPVTIANTGVLSFSGGTTGLTPATATTGAITLAGTLVAGNGGTGVATLTGLAYGSGTSAFTAATAAQVVSTIGSTAVTNATNAVNTGITLTSTGATNYLTFVTTTSGNLPQLVNSSITVNAVNGTITGGIAGGSF